MFAAFPEVCRIKITNGKIKRIGRGWIPSCNICNLPCNAKSAGALNRAVPKNGGKFYCETHWKTLRILPTSRRACKWCNGSFIQGLTRTRPNSGKFCSKQCYAQWQSSPENQGSYNPRWKGGYQGRNCKRPEYIKWRNEVYRRDNYTCNTCRVRGGKLVAHHIKLYSSFPELELALDNGITLCKSCHQRLHLIGRLTGASELDPRNEAAVMQNG